MRTSSRRLLARYLSSLARILAEDWGLVLVALMVAIVFWWDATQHQNVARYFPDVELKLVDLPPTLKRTSELPKVSVRVTGPRVLDDLDSNDFLLRVDCARITDASRHLIALDPKGLTPIIRLISADELRVRPEDISPRTIELTTEWNRQEAWVVPQYRGQPASGYVVSSTWISPATMMIAGGDADLALHRVIKNKNVLVLNGETSTREQIWTLNDLDLGNVKVLGDANPTVRFRVHIAPRDRNLLLRDIPVRAEAGSGLLDQFGKHTITPDKVDILVQGPTVKIMMVAREAVSLGLDLSQLPWGESQYPVNRLRPLNLPEELEILSATPSNLSVWLDRPVEIGPVLQPQPIDAPQPLLIPSATGQAPLIAPETIPSATPETQP